jgi:hypothetical protein
MDEPLPFGTLHKQSVATLKQLAIQAGLQQCAMLGLEKLTLVELVRMSRRALTAKRIEEGLEPELTSILSLPLVGTSLPSDSSQPHEILPCLWLGGADYTEEWLATTGITHILNCASSFPRDKEGGITFLGLSMTDDPTYPIQQHFEACFEFISRALSQPESRLLVHCMQGVSRSATIVIGYIMLKYSLSLEQAEYLVKLRRSCISPNIGFYDALMTVQDGFECAKGTAF